MTAPDKAHTEGVTFIYNYIANKNETYENWKQATILTGYDRLLHNLIKNLVSETGWC